MNEIIREQFWAVIMTKFSITSTISRKYIAQRKIIIYNNIINIKQVKERCFTEALLFANNETDLEGLQVKFKAWLI